MYRLISRIYPKKLRENIGLLLNYANISTDTDNFIGFITLFSLLISLIIGFFVGFIYEIGFGLVTIVVFVIIMTSFYFWFLVNADKKAKYTEEILPDALFLMASNLRSGFTADKAILLSARDEFGPFKDELINVSKEIATGKSLEKALLGVTKRIKSEKLEKTFSLIISGLKSGGRLADLLQETANDLKNQKLIDKKVRTSVNMYTIFIFIAAGVGAPVLFGLSSFLVEVLTTTLRSVEVPTAVSGAFNIPIAIKPGDITTKFIIIYSVISIITTSIFGSFIIGLIKKGREKDGITLIPLLILLSLFIFFAARIMVKGTIGSLFAI